jgi:hypothetical protein
VGFFKDIANAFGNATGTPDHALLQTGILARGEIVGFAPSGMTIQVGNGLVERKCTITLSVMVDREPRYQAVVEQRIPEVYLPQLASGSAVVTVRVDPADRNRVAVDLATPVPTIHRPWAQGENGPEYILANGAQVVVVLVANQPTGLLDPEDNPIELLTLTVAEGVPTPYQTQTPNSVPASALPLVYPGSRLHGRVGPTPQVVLIDWTKGAAPAAPAPAV